jgi:hypothetical protein
MSATDRPTTQARPRPQRLMKLLLFLAAHVMLGVAIRLVPAVAILHAVGCLAVGIFVAGTRRTRYVAYTIAYLAGSEVLWRLSKTSLFHELAQYEIAAVVLVALVRMRASRNRWLALGYFLLLLPSAALTIGALDSADETRQVLSFNLSGPLTLMLCIIFFSNVRLEAADLRKVFWSLIGPVIGIATIAVLSTAAVRDLEFGRQSNHITAGGFGPNQVSSMLGLAALFAILMVLDRTLRWRIRILLLGIAGVLAIQSALTFSRAGVLMAMCSIVAASVFLLQNGRARVTIVVVGLVLGLVGNYVVAPRLEEFTHGQIGERYSSLDSDGRTKIASLDLQIFADNPLLGVGPGAATELRIEGRHIAAHTEYTRMLAEHGCLGALAIVLLVLLGLRTFRQARAIEARALVAALLAWSALFLGINGMRLAAVSFVAGLACSIAFSSLRPARARKARGPAVAPPGSALQPASTS